MAKVNWARHTSPYAVQREYLGSERLACEISDQREARLDHGHVRLTEKQRRTSETPLQVFAIKILCPLRIVLPVQWTSTGHPLDITPSLTRLVPLSSPAHLSNGRPCEVHTNLLRPKESYVTCSFEYMSSHFVSLLPPGNKATGSQY